MVPWTDSKHAKPLDDLEAMRDRLALRYGMSGLRLRIGRLALWHLQQSQQYQRFRHFASVNFPPVDQLRELTGFHSVELFDDDDLRQQWVVLTGCDHLAVPVREVLIPFDDAASTDATTPC